MKSMSKKLILFIDAVAAVLAIVLDQFTKFIVRGKLGLYQYVDVIPGVFQFYHHENTGASWGLFKGGKVFFVIIACVVVAGIIVLLGKIPAEKKYLQLNLALSLIAAGAVGNVIDRIHKGSVTDFLYAKIIDFPVFNVADIFIVCATAWLMILIIFVYKDDDLKFLEKKDTSVADKKE